MSELGDMPFNDKSEDWPEKGTESDEKPAAPSKASEAPSAPTGKAKSATVASEEQEALRWAKAQGWFQAKMDDPPKVERAKKALRYLADRCDQ